MHKKIVYSIATLFIVLACGSTVLYYYLYTLADASVPQPLDTSRPLTQHDNWKLTFEDDFEGSELDLNKWEPTWFGEGTVMNNVKTYKKNVSVKDGLLSLQLSAKDEGALIHTGYQPGHYQLPTEAYIEARIRFAGNGDTLYNWPAWWINSTKNYPQSGEHDVAEGLEYMTVNYHSVENNQNLGKVPGVWTNNFHIYGIYRKKNSAEVYYDNKLVKKYKTNDDGKPLDIILNIGTGQGPTVIGKDGAMFIDYVRAWEVQ